MEKTSVPSDLLPLADKDIDENWAMRNYQYRTIFNCQSLYGTATHDDVLAWMTEAKLLCNELREYGTAKAEERIVKLCNHYYKDRLENETVTNMYQVIGLMSKPIFYEERYDLFLDLLHMFQYGIFRCAYNAWAVDAANDWMAKRNIVYESHKDSMLLNKKRYSRRGKGFVYRLLVSRASNTICVRFQKLTKRLYKEYIIVRDRKFNRIADATDIVEHMFNKSYHGYIIKLNGHAGTIHASLTPNKKEQVHVLVEKALENGVSFDTVIQVLQNLTIKYKQGN